MKIYPTGTLKAYQPSFASEGHRKMIEKKPKETSYDSRKTRIMPQGKAVQYKTGFCFNLDKIPEGFFGLSALSFGKKPVLIDFNEKDMTEAQKKLFEEGKITTEVPVGYYIQGNKLKQG